MYLNLDRSHYSPNQKERTESDDYKAAVDYDQLQSISKAILPVIEPVSIA